MGAKPGDGMANHHLIPEEVMKNRQFAGMFKHLKSMGFNPDGAPNGIFLPGSKELAEQLKMPGHWSNHSQYTRQIQAEVSRLNTLFKSGSSDTQLAMGIREIQATAAENLRAGRFAVDPITGRLL